MPPRAVKNKDGRSVVIMFIAELVVGGIWLATRDYVSGLGLGGLIFVLPGLIALTYMAVAVYALPIIGFGVVKNRSSYNKVEVAVAGFAAAVNAAAAVWLSYQLIVLFSFR